jgi:hypothetical protein
MSNCHCSQCRKAYGSAFGTIAVVRKADFRYISGQALMGSFRSTERVTRYHCTKCGSPLPLYEEWDSLVGIPAGLLEDDAQCKPTMHIFTGSKAPWWEVTDTNPQFKEWAPGQDMNQRASELKSGKNQ